MTDPSDIVQRLRVTHFLDGHEIGMTKQRAEAADEIERLRKLLEPCRPDTDAQTDASYPKTVDDVLSLLSAYIADFLPDDVCPDDEYFGAWERQARRVIGPLMESNTTLRAQLAVANTAILGVERNRDAWHDQAVRLESQLAEARAANSELASRVHEVDAARTERIVELERQLADARAALAEARIMAQIYHDDATAHGRLESDTLYEAKFPWLIGGDGGETTNGGDA